MRAHASYERSFAGSSRHRIAENTEITTEEVRRSWGAEAVGIGGGQRERASPAIEARAPPGSKVAAIPVPPTVGAACWPEDVALRRHGRLPAGTLRDQVTRNELLLVMPVAVRRLVAADQ